MGFFYEHDKAMKLLLIAITILITSCANRIDYKINELCVIKNSGEVRIKGSEAWFYLENCNKKDERWKINAKDNSQEVPTI